MYIVSGEMCGGFVWWLLYLCLITCTCISIQSMRVKPASPTELAMSQAQAPQARRSCASSLEAFSPSFLHRAKPKTRGPRGGRGTRSAWSRLPTSSAGLQFACATCEAVWLKSALDQVLILDAAHSLFMIKWGMSQNVTSVLTETTVQYIEWKIMIYKNSHSFILTSSSRHAPPLNNDRCLQWPLNISFIYMLD